MINTLVNFESNRFVIGIIKNEDVISLGLNSTYDPTTQEKDGIDNIAHCLIGSISEDDESIAGILARKSKKIVID